MLMMNNGGAPTDIASRADCATVRPIMSVVDRESDLLKDGVSSAPSAEDQDLMREEAQKMSSVLPTMWLGAQNGW